MEAGSGGRRRLHVMRVIKPIANLPFAIHIEVRSTRRVVRWRKEVVGGSGCVRSHDYSLALECAF